MSDFGVHSEVGKLRTVIVHRPDLSLKRLTPTNHDDLLFDDVLWVRRARQQHDQFADLLRDRGTQVVYLEELLAELPSRVRGSRERFSASALSVLRGIADELNLVTRDELDELELRVAQLEHRMKLLEGPRDQPPPA